MLHKIINFLFGPDELLEYKLHVKYDKGEDLLVSVWGVDFADAKERARDRIRYDIGTIYEDEEDGFCKYRNIIAWKINDREG